MKITPHASKSAVLHAFSVESDRSAETLAAYLTEYPQFRESLIELSIELFLTPSFDEDSSIETVPSDNAKRAWSTFQSMLEADDPASAIHSRMDNPLSNLSGQKFRELVRKLNVNSLFLSRLRDNAIYVATIPRQFLALLAEHLNMPVERLERALDTQPTVASGLRHKAPGKPKAGEKLTFEDALTTSGLNDDQQASLRAMKD